MPSIYSKGFKDQEGGGENPANNAPLVQKILTPYRKRHIAQYKGASLFYGERETRWITADRYLTDRMINRTIAGQALYGFFLAYSAQCFGIDIDDHYGNGGRYLTSVYSKVCAQFEACASLLVRTPHGLHAFYLLKHLVPEVLLIARVRELMRGIPVEVKPTAEIGLRLPVEKNLLDPKTLQPLGKPFAEAVGEARKYHPVELFYDGLSSRLFLESLRAERQGKPVADKTWEKLCRVEAEYAGILPGTTNDALCEIIPVYRSAGLTEEEAAAEFAALFAPCYGGELRNPRRLFQRVSSFYRHIPDTRFTIIPQKIQVELFTSLIAESIAALYTAPAETNYQRGALTKKKQTIKKAVFQIERWRLYIDGVKRTKFLEMWDYLYPYFKKNTKEGYYPLSRNILKKVHEHYERYLLAFLVEIGYLKRSPYRYSSVYGICYYYEINSHKFIDRIDRQPKPEPEAAAKPKRKAELRAEAVRAYKREHPDMSNRAIAKVFEVDEITIRRILKDYF